MHYTAAEERLNIISHAIGIPLSIIALFSLLRLSNGSLANTATWIFGMSLLILYTASTCYHSSTHKKLRSRLRILDHAAIYILIAGTYTPVCLIPLKDSIGNEMLIVVWSLAVAGIVLKLFFTGKFDRVSTAMYILTGWVALGGISYLIEFLTEGELFWLFAGGFFYTIGAILYSIDRIPYNHAIFHVFVLAGSICHYVMVFFIIYYR